MDENRIVGMIDEEIERLQQVQQILQTLLPGESAAAQMVEALSEPVELEASATPQPMRHVSRRGIATGRRGPRRVQQSVVARPLDSPVPKAPVVVSRAAVAATQQARVVAVPPAPAEGTLEAWVRSMRPAVSPA